MHSQPLCMSIRPCTVEEAYRTPGFVSNAWSRYQIPMRAPPMPVDVAVALARYFIRMDHIDGAFVILLGFDCFLRTGEMLSLFRHYSRPRR